MKTVLFVCHGNICRSPMAMFIFRELVRRAGRETELRAFSRATSTEEIGNGLYPEALSPNFDLKIDGINLINEKY